MSERQPSSRGNPSMADVVRSVAVLGAIIVVIWLIGQFFTNTPVDPTPTIDYQSVVDQARPAAEFDLLAPTSLPEGWKATSARFSPTAWHLGVLTDDREYIGLEQVGLTERRAIEKFAPDSEAAGEVSLAGESWDSFTGPASDDKAFVRRDGDVTVLIVASASMADVEAYASSLSPD